MNKKRKSCPVHQRPFLEMYDFNKHDKTTYHGTETVRGLNKFERKWFRVKAVAVISSSKTVYGATLVVPYVDIEGEKYWLIDKERKEKNIRLVLLYGDKAIL